MQKIDMAGLRFSRWTVLRQADASPRGEIKWLCRCDCGVTRPVFGTALRNGISKSCGCLNLEVLHSRSTTHGATLGRKRSPEYSVWVAMKARCCNPKNPNWRHYGGRGISICPQWRNDFAQFRADMGRRPSLQHTIDRTDNDLGYAPDNCQWATKSAQVNNRRADHGARTSEGIARARVIRFSQP